MIDLQAKKRVRAVFVIFLILLAMTVAKLFHVQIVRHELLKGRAEQNWDIEVPFGGMRGTIMDRNGGLIVGNKLAPTLYFMPAQNPDIDTVASSLAEILQTDRAKLEEKLSKRTYMIKIAPEGKKHYERTSG